MINPEFKPRTLQFQDLHSSHEAALSFKFIYSFIKHLLKASVFAFFLVAMIRYINKGNLNKKRFIWLTILGVVHHCGEIKAVGA